MLHNSHVIYEPQDAGKKLKANGHCKINGSYFEAPLVEKTLSTKPHAWRHVFRCVVQQFLPGKQTKQDKKNTEHFLNQTPMQCTTMKLMNLEKISQPNPNILKAYRRHYRVDIKQFLKRKYQKQTYELPLQAFQCLRLVDENDKSKQYKTKCAYFFKPYYINDNLKKRMECSEKWSKKMFNIKSLATLFRQLLKCSIQFGGLDNFIMTTSNIYVQENLETLQINYTSFAGLGVLKCGSSVGAHQYFQIIPYFTKHMLETNEIGVQDRIRFFLINCLCAIEKKDLIIEAQTVEANHTFKYDDVQKIVKGGQITNQFRAQIKGLVLKDKKKVQLDKYQIINLIQRGLVNQEQLTWHQIAQKICTGPSEDKISKLKLDGLLRSQTNRQKVTEAFKKLHQQLYQQDPQKQFYKKRGLDSELIYIPVRFRVDFSQIFEQKAWWDIFNIVNSNNEKGNPNFFNFLLQNFCFRLADAIIRRYEKQQRNADWIKRFKQDQALHYIFQYLNLSEISNLILPYDKNKEAILFNETYQKYKQLVRQAGEDTQNVTKILQ